MPKEENRKIENYVAYLRKSKKRSSGLAAKRSDIRTENFIGMWADREDMTDSVEWVRKVRRSHWSQ